MTRRIFLLAATAALAHPALAQRAGTIPALKLVEDWRIDAKAGNLEQTVFISIAPNGNVISLPSLLGRDGVRYGGGSVVAYDSAGKTQIWRLQTGFNNDFEIRFVTRIGYTGSQMWISDRGYDQFAFVTPQGKVTKTAAYPPLARPSVTDRHKYPVYDSMDPLARYADGSMLVRPFGKNAVFDTPEFDTTATHLLRISSGGVIQQDVASYPADIAAANNRSVIAVPREGRTLGAVSGDGSRIVVASTSMSGKDSATIGVTMLGEKGDTLYKKRYPFTPVTLSAKARDSVLRKNGGTDGLTSEQLRAKTAKLVPPFFPPLLGLIIGNDRTVWVALRHADDKLMTWLSIDPAGEPLGTITVPRTTHILAGDRSRVWATVTDSNKVVAVTRMRVSTK